MLKSSLCDSSNAYILVKVTTTVFGQEANNDAIIADRNNKQVILKNCGPFIECISKISNTQVDIVIQ